MVQLEAAVATLAAAGVPAGMSFIIGFPGESDAERNETLDVIDRLQRRHPGATARVTVYTPWPGTPLWSAALDAGFRAPESNEAWARSGRDWVELPWLEAAAAAQIALTSRYACCRTADLRPAGYALYRPLAGWRWRHRRFGFPLEAHLHRLVTKR